MEYQILNRKVKFNVNKNIGSVLYIVEGERREINLLGYLFKNILHYERIYGVDREGRERIYVSEQNENSKIFIINSEKSNIQSITNKEFIDKQVTLLKRYEEDFNYEDIPIYYIFDCDRKNDQNNIEMLVNMFGNAREPSKENEYDSIGGMLLLSYPSIETLMNAFNELAKSLDNIDENISEINLDDIRVFNKNVFEKEKRYNNQYMLSLLLISFVDLGIIEFI